MPNSVRIIVLCEDVQHRSFAERYLKQQGYKSRDIETRPLIGNAGAGSQSVLNRYADEVRNYRSRTTRARSALLVVIDADNQSLEARRAEFDKRLVDNRQNKREADEQIAILIPARNIESWIHCLLNTDEAQEEMNEIKRFSKFAKNESKCWPAADQLAKMLRNNEEPPDTWPKSLIAGYEELRRLS